MIRIALTREDFKALVNGEVVKKESREPSTAGIGFTVKRDIEIILKDIGFNAMAMEVRKAIEKSNA